MPRRSDQKEWIQRQAAALWATKGYDAGVQELCDVTGLGKGALYYHIGSKTKLLYEMLRGQLEDIIAGGEAIAAGPEPARTRLRMLSRHLLRSIADARPEWTVFQQEVNVLGGARRDEIMALRARYERVWRDLLAEGEAAGELAPVSDVVVKGILGMHNYSYLWLRADGSLSPEDVADQFCDVLIGGLQASGPAGDRAGRVDAAFRIRRPAAARAR